MTFKSHFGNPTLPTAQDVIRAIKSHAEIPERRKRSMVAAWETACEWFGIAPDQFIAHHMNLRPRFSKLSPGALGVTKKRIANVRCEIKRSLDWVSGSTGRSFKAPLTPEWLALEALIPNRYLRVSVSCIFRLASARLLLPGEVDDAFSMEVLRAVTEEGLNKRPHITHQNSARAWNQLVDLVKAWPRTKLKVPRYATSYVLPWSQFQPDLVREIEAFLNRRTTVDPFDLDTPIKAWSAATVVTYRELLRRYLTLLVLAGRDPNKMRTLADITTFEAVDEALKSKGLQTRAKGRKTAASMAGLLAQIAAIPLSVADLEQETRDRLKTNVENLSTLAVRLRKLGTESRNNRDRLAPLRHESNLAKLLLLPFALERELSKLKSPSRAAALLMQWAVALMILTFCPLRMSSLCAIRLDQHLVWARPEMAGSLSLEFADGELKNGEPASMPLPTECARLIRLYVRRFRPKLAPPGSPFLFSGAFDDKPKLAGVLSTQLSRLIFDRTGFAVNPHLYRHIVHLIVLKRFPGAYAMIARILTHRSITTTIKNYSYFDAELSMAAYQKLVREVQNGTAEINSATPSAVAHHLNQGAYDHD